MERDPITSDSRRERRRRRGTAELVCAVCGERDRAAFPRRPHIVEEHHAAGRANDAELVVSLCLTHHALATELQRDLGVELSYLPERSVLERVEAALRSLAAFFQLLAERLVAWADSLRALVVSLDGAHPDWRQLPEAR